MGGSGQMNFLIHSIGSTGDFDSWQLDGWDSQSMKMTFDRMSCWMDADPVSRSFLHFQPEECTADFLQPKATKGKPSPMISTLTTTNESTKIPRIHPSILQKDPP